MGLSSPPPAWQRGISLLHRWLMKAAGLVRRHPLRAVLCLPGLLLLYVVLLVPFTPGIGDLRKAKSALPSVLLSSDGVVLAEYRRMNRSWVPLDHIAPSVVQALISTEDHRFYEHLGIDPRRTLGAVFYTLQGDLQGGSTITQQLARNLYPEEIGRAASLTRKLKEAITALKIEAVYSKPEILETYLNTVPFLYNAFGIEMAARTYFDKSAQELDVLEAATLIGMLKGTSYYNPVQNPERARERRNLVLAQMVRHGHLDAQRVQALAKRPLKLDFERQQPLQGPAPHVAQQLRKWLIAWADDKGYDIHADGLRVVTTLDSRLQKAAVAALERQLGQLQRLADAGVPAGQERPPLQAGFLAMDPRDGAVRAWVGSRDFAQEQFDHVSQARRQPGSTFKPFVYGAAFLNGFGAYDMPFVDQPVAITPKGGGPVWTPTDDSPSTGALITLRDALAQSRNTITAQLIDRIGPEPVAELARALGVRQSKLELVPSLALGTSPVTLQEMVTAYASIADEGRYHAPVLVVRVEDRHGGVLEQFLPNNQPVEQVMPRDKALELADAMRGVVDEGTGAAIRGRYGIRADVAGKTGTTQDNTDGWFILMHPQLVAGARVGFNDNRATMGNWGQGARSALPMVGEVFQQALRQRWIDAKVEFAIPRPVPRPPPEVPAAPQEPASVPAAGTVIDAIGEFIDGLFRQSR